MSGAKTCLNCDMPISGVYCAQCGQKTSTHRLSLGHFIKHELIHGIWHIDKGIVFTLRNILARPGYAAKDYIKGKRANHFNLVTLLLLLTGLLILIHQAHHTKTLDDNIAIEGDAVGIVAWIEHNLKWVLLSFVPVISISGYWIFRRPKFNFTEHLVFNSFIIAGIFLILIILDLLMWAMGKSWPSRLYLPDILPSIFLLIAYWQMFRSYYSMGGWIWRTIVFMIVFIVCFVLIAIFILLLYSLIFTGGNIGGRFEISS